MRDHMLIDIQAATWGNAGVADRWMVAHMLIPRNCTEHVDMYNSVSLLETELWEAEKCRYHIRYVLNAEEVFGKLTEKS